ncbi:hypothetical protein TrVFT333_007525 [Trichoderma virens FT-333]|nr:hypothetical protein TrVFT333_007525 [Trichoderma virens FT-333]
MSQIGSQTTAQNLDFWVRDDALFVIDLLFELRLEKGPDYSIYTPEAFADIRIKLISQHPKCHRLHKYIEGRFQELKTLWAIFEDAIKLPGTTWGNYTGMLAMSPGNQDIVIERHGLYGHRVVFYGLPVGQGVTIETWGRYSGPLVFLLVGI